ncbi:16S rRNA (guanine(527)-N(7))-methyltransferase RsmG [Alginatibacterium sediminis]|uniref:Ribosomal RNA small subunit methyltransferase G n=1 Tax=Alginatibacterium sediminis TaxID=2164068 RepID=A0A420END2_9ALTE|nr:16S rRNA (guanine(527)-N(7))-methyltransferase RsmG [Alginatibacterium sediminis]RKF22245.1 16S rRNA (guanine(527)-N(7))-methyltransferase RsmG [Alginatibacterium sediminis]
MLEAHFDHLVSQTSLVITEDQKQQLLALVGLLDKWNKAYNLTSVRDPKDMLVKHILDSLVVSEHLQGERFIDVGTGPGLPGLPLAIINPDKQFVLLDSLGKRIRFIKQVCFELKIDNVQTQQCRVEAFQDEHGFDGVLSRAFASLDDMLSWCSHLSSKNGKFYALKGQLPREELENLPDHLELEQSIALQVPTLEGERHLVIIRDKSK